MYELNVVEMLIFPQTIGMRWFPQRKGMAMGIVVGGFGFGAFVFNQVCASCFVATSLNTAAFPKLSNADPDCHH